MRFAESPCPNARLGRPARPCCNEPCAASSTRRSVRHVPSPAPAAAARDRARWRWPSPRAAADDGGKATSSTDVNQLLKDTFSGDKNVKSGKLHLALKLDGSRHRRGHRPGRRSRSPGRSRARARASCRSSTWTRRSRAPGQNIKAGATSTGDKGFVSFQGQDYVVSDQVFKQFKAGYEQAQKQAKASSKASRCATLGIDPRKWLKNPQNEGEAKVGDTDTIKITGGVDVDRMLDDINKASSQARSLGLQGVRTLPSKLTPEQRKQAGEGDQERQASRSTPARTTRSCAGCSSSRDRPGHRRPRPRTSTSTSPHRRQRGPGHREPVERQAVRPAAGAARGSPGSSAAAARAARARAAARAAPAQRRQRGRPQEVLRVRRRRPATTPPRRRSAPTC